MDYLPLNLHSCESYENIFRYKIIKIRLIEIYREVLNLMFKKNKAQK